MERATNKKLGFYNSVKTNFGLEPYLKSDIPHQHLKRFAEFRMSSHRYNIETGRHGLSKQGDILHRICYQCSTNDKQVLENLKELPFFCPIIEDECHILRTCTLYEDLRHKLSDDSKTCIFGDLDKAFKDVHVVKEIAKFLTMKTDHERRFWLNVRVFITVGQLVETVFDFFWSSVILLIFLFRILPLDPSRLQSNFHFYLRSLPHRQSLRIFFLFLFLLTFFNFCTGCCCFFRTVSFICNFS